MDHVETDPISGAELYRLVDDPRKADNIYGEQPYSARSGDNVVVRFFDTDGRNGGLSILDLTDGSQRTVLEEEPRFPAFHAWGEYLYFQTAVDDRIVLNRCRFETGETERVTTLPEIPGEYSYGTVSQDNRYYAVSTRQEDLRQVLLVDLATEEHRLLTERTEYLFKHEQFSRDGTNRILVQANEQSREPAVRLGVLDVEQADEDGIDWFETESPHTSRPTGHEAWVGETDRILFVTADEDEQGGNLWTVGIDDDEPRRVIHESPRYHHVSASRCGRYWVCDASHEPAAPIHVGSIETGEHKHVIDSRTVVSNDQATHAHPYLTADNRWLIFNSTRAGRPQVFGARIPDGYLDEL